MDTSRSRVAPWMLMDTPLGWVTRGDVAEYLAEADERVAEAERAAALATYEAELARYQYRQIANRRAVRLATELAASRQPAKLRTTPRRLRRAAELRPIGEPPQPPQLEEPANVGQRTAAEQAERGWLPPRPTRPPRFPHLRVLHLGATARFGRLTPHTTLSPDTWREQLEQGADLLLVEPPESVTAWDPFGASGDGELARVLAAAEELGVPSVRLSSGASGGGAAGPGTPSLELTEALGTADGVVLPSVDTALFNPVGWRRDPPDPVVAVLATELDDAARRLLEGFEPPVMVVRPPDLKLAPGLPFSRHAVSPAGLRRSFIRAGVLLDHPSWRGDATTALRRWAAALACGTPVVTCDATSVVVEPPPGVIDVAEADLVDAVHTLLTDPDLRERHGIAARRWALRNAAREPQLRGVLERLDFPVPGIERTTVLLSTHRPNLLEHALDSVERQRQPHVDIALVLHGDAFDDVDLPRNERISSVTRAPGSWTLGDCLNAALDNAGGELVAKMDDDDHYGAEHLADLVDAWRYSGADVVGKPVEFVHIAERDVTLRRPAVRTERDRRHVGGPTPLASRDVLLRHRFLRLPNRVDSTLYERVLADGGRVYGIHTRDFVLERHGDAHAWDIDDSRLLDTAVDQRAGLAIDMATSDPATGV